nr:hypothetical protein [Tanacetum cinerariifolium]GEY67013.1 hypothetical protein [Tanacetum cinerariifolium]
MQSYTPRCIQKYRQAKDHDIKFYCTFDIKSKIKILDHKHAEGTAKNSQDNKVLTLEQYIYAVGSKNHPPMLNKDNHVPWSSRIIGYARSRPNGKMIVDSIENGPYVGRMIATPGEPDLPVPFLESFHEQTYEELTETDIKWMDADD